MVLRNINKGLFWNIFNVNKLIKKTGVNIKPT